MESRLAATGAGWGLAEVSESGCVPGSALAGQNNP